MPLLLRPRVTDASPKKMNDAVQSVARILVIEDHGLLAQSLRLALTAEGMAVTIPTLDAAAILETAERERPDVVLLDLDLGPLGGDGSVLIEPLRLGGARVLVVSGITDRVRIGACIESGAHDFLPKSVALADLLTAVRAAIDGTGGISAAARDETLAELRQSREIRRSELEPFSRLTERERFVLGEIMAGLSAADIAAGAFVSEATIRTQIRSVLAKLEVNSQLAAVAKARLAGWHSSDS
jgi:two-component system nitrate/nitrite response regulator NarL